MAKKAFERIWELSQLRTDGEVLAFIQEIRRHANRDFTYKLIAEVMSQPGAHCQNTQWIARIALESVLPPVAVSTIPKVKVEYVRCPLCAKQTAKGNLATHFLAWHRWEEVVPKIRTLSNDLKLNLLHSLQKSQKLAKQLSIPLVCQSVPPSVKNHFEIIEAATVQWQSCFEGYACPPELEELKVKVLEVRFAINSSWIKFEVVHTRETIAETMVPKVKTETSMPKAKTKTKASTKRTRSSSSVWAIQCGHPGSGRRG